MTEQRSDRSGAVPDATPEDWLGSNRDPDVLLSVPDVGVDRIALNVENLHADVDLHARVLDIVELHVGAAVDLGKVELEIENVRAQAMLKVKLDKVAQIVERVMETIDNNPELITSLTARVGRGVEELARNAGEGVREIGARSGREPATPHEIETYRAQRYDERLANTVDDETPVIETVVVDGEWWNRVNGEELGPYSSRQAAVEKGRDLADRKSGRHLIRPESVPTAGHEMPAPDVTVVPEERHAPTESAAPGETSAPGESSPSEATPVPSETPARSETTASDENPASDEDKAPGENEEEGGDGGKASKLP